MCWVRKSCQALWRQPDLAGPAAGTVELSSVCRAVAGGSGGRAGNVTGVPSLTPRLCWQELQHAALCGSSASISSGKAKFLHYLGLIAALPAFCTAVGTERVSELSGQGFPWLGSQVWLFQEMFGWWSCSHCNPREEFYGWGWGSSFFLTGDQFIPLKHDSRYLWPFIISQCNIRYYSYSY